MAAQHTSVITHQQEFRWSFRKKGKDVLKLCRHLSVVVILAGGMTGLAAPANANPTGGVVTGGAATISSSGSTVTINQSTNRAIIEWSSFDIAAGETTRFVQPSSSALALNRVVNSNQATAINGNLQANGRVLVINPNGVLIGATGNVDVSGFVASTADIDDARFMTASGAMEFDRAGKLDATVENKGRITIRDAGLGLMVAPTVRNSGVIEGNMAKLHMGAGDTFAVDLYGDGLLHLAVGNTGPARTIKAENAGTIVANAGKVVMTAAAANNVVNSVINTSGVIEAKGLVAKGGEIILTGAGADIKVAGKLDASGKTGGGSIKIGGDTKGTGTLAKAKTTEIASGAQINADALAQGNGGTIVVWSDALTTSRGRYSAKGGSVSGNGGFVETSSKTVLDVGGSFVDTSAAFGAYGKWLLDPANLVVDAPAAAAIGSALSDVYLDAEYNISFAANVNMLNAGVGLYAHAWMGDIDILNQTITLNGGNFNLQAGRDIKINNSTIITKGGDVEIVSFERDAGIKINNSNINTTGGLTNATLTFLEAGRTKTFSDVFNPANSTLKQDSKGGDVYIRGRTLSGNSVCIAAGGAGCGAAAPIAITVRADNKYKIYGGVDPSLTYTVSAGALMSGDAFAGALARAAGNNVGTYAINQGTLGIVTAGAYTYVLTFIPGTLTIDPAILTITARNQGKTYGDTMNLGNTAFDVAGLQYADSVTGVMLSSAGSAATAAAGTYGISASSAVGSGLSNYTIGYAPGTLTVNKAALTLTANNRTKVYGSALNLGSTAFTASGLKNTDSVTSASLTSAGRVASAGVGTYDINIANAAGSGLSNYTISYAPGSLTVNPAALTITARDQSKVYGDSRNVDGAFLPYFVSGLKNFDYVSDVTLTSAGGAATANVGNYDIVASNAVGGGLSNYTISYVNGNLAVTRATLLITADSFSKTYGNTHTFDNTDYGVYGLKNADTVTGVTLSSNGAAATANVGLYGIFGSNAVGTGLSNYNIAYTPGLMLVNPAQLTISALDQSKTYGTSYTLNPLAYNVAGLKNADSVTGVMLASAGTSASANAGLYQINVSNASGTGLSNYRIAYNPGTLTVNKAALTLTANSLSKSYGSTVAFNGSEFATLGTLYNGDTVTGATIGSAGAAASANAGSYGVTIADAIGSGLANYDISYVDGTLSVNRAALMLVANNQNKNFGTAFTFNGSEFTTVGTLYNGDTVTGATLSSPGAAANASAVFSPYNIYVSNASGKGVGNYDISYVSGLMTVNAPTLNNTSSVLSALNRPIVSVANKVIVQDRAFEGIETRTLDADVALRYRGGAAPAASSSPTVLAALEPAAGGEGSTPEELASLEPAAGDAQTPAANGGSDIDCANSFLDNRPCGVVQ